MNGPYYNLWAQCLEAHCLKFAQQVRIDKSIDFWPIFPSQESPFKSIAIPLPSLLTHSPVNSICGSPVSPLCYEFLMHSGLWKVPSLVSINLSPLCYLAYKSLMNQA